jgi:hypothetical protein
MGIKLNTHSYSEATTLSKFGNFITELLQYLKVYQLLVDRLDHLRIQILGLTLQLFAVLKSFLENFPFLSSNARFFISPHNTYLLALKISGFTLHLKTTAPKNWPYKDSELPI